MAPQARLSRRSLIRAGTALALGGLWLCRLAARERGAPSAVEDGGPPEDAARRPPRARQAILVWLDGGPSHLETFDPKPAAPAEVRGPLAPIQTCVPGVWISELLPQMARRLDRVALVRSVTSPLGEHNLATHYMLTGYPPNATLEYPVLGSVVAHERAGATPLPGHLAVPDFRVGGKRLSGNGFLPPHTRPFEVAGDPARPDFQVPDLTMYPGLDGKRLDRRRQYLQALAQLRRSADMAAIHQPDQAAPLEAAYRLLSTPAAREAFDLTKESPATRARYGPRTIGQCLLLARRLIEAQVPFVTVNFPGWDTHQSLLTTLRDGFAGATVPVGLVPSLDTALAALLDDLADRSLLPQTLVMVMGEFGRTPKINPQQGRDHWPRVFSVLWAGGGVPGGQVVGASDAMGESPAQRPVTPADLVATAATLLGIDPQTPLTTPDGRTIPVSRDGRPVPELVG